MTRMFDFLELTIFQATSKNWKIAPNIYEFSAKDIDGNDTCLEKYRGHVCLILNVASR